MINGAILAMATRPGLHRQIEDDNRMASRRFCAGAWSVDVRGNASSPYGNIAGVLDDYWCRRASIEWAKSKVSEARDRARRRAAHPTDSICAEYPGSLSVPSAAPGPHFFSGLPDIALTSNRGFCQPIENSAGSAGPGVRRSPSDSPPAARIKQDLRITMPLAAAAAPMPSGLVFYA